MNKSRVLLLLIPFLLLALFFVPASAATYDGAVWIDGNNEGDHIADFAIAAQAVFPVSEGYLDILSMEPHLSYDQGLTSSLSQFQIVVHPGDPMTIDWTAPPGIVVYYVFVKASDGGWLYAYKNGATSGAGLASEMDSISHVSLYYTGMAETPTPPIDTPTPPVHTPTPPDATITAEATLTEPPLPQTGGVDSNLMYLLGSGLLASGFLLRRRSRR
jgi:LPXTG-motif cell wall-anchored protein